MIVQDLPSARELAEAFRLPELTLATVKGLFIFVIPFVLLIYLLERRAGVDVARYRSKTFFTDVLYSLFYRGGFYSILVFAAVASALEPQLEFLNLGLLSGAPFGVTLAVFWIGGDFLLYWVHRLQHSSKLLWAFHSVHHATEELTTLTQYRRHPVDWLVGDFLMFVVFVLVLGIRPGTWLPLYIGMTTLQALQHAELDWRYGRLYRVFVSPVFHSFHHSREARHHHGNYAQMFSIWDFLFGTAVGDSTRPRAYGVPGLKIAESFVRQMAIPFGFLFGHSGRRAIGETVGRPTGKGNTPPPPRDLDAGPDQSDLGTHDSVRVR